MNDKRKIKAHEGRRHYDLIFVLWDGVAYSKYEIVLCYYVLFVLFQGVFLRVHLRWGHMWQWGPSPSRYSPRMPPQFLYQPWSAGWWNSYHRWSLRMRMNQHLRYVQFWPIHRCAKNGRSERHHRFRIPRLSWSWCGHMIWSMERPSQLRLLWFWVSSAWMVMSRCFNLGEKSALPWSADASTSPSARINNADQCLHINSVKPSDNRNLLLALQLVCEEIRFLQRKQGQRCHLIHSSLSWLLYWIDYFELWLQWSVVCSACW